MLVVLLVLLPAVKSAQLVASLDSSLAVAARQLVMALLLLAWFVVVTRDDRGVGRVEVRQALGLVVAGRGASRSGAAAGRIALLAAFLAGFVVAPTWGRAPLVALSIVGAGSLWWVARRTTSQHDSPPAAERALVVTLLPPIVVYAVVGVVLLATEQPSDAHVGEVLRVVVVTAAGEELIYRGLLLALAMRVLGARAAVLATSCSFGLWHVGDALVATEDAPVVAHVVGVVGVVAATTVGGLVFAWSRIRTGSLVGPILLHTATNLPGIALGVEVDVDDTARGLAAMAVHSARPS